MNPLTCAEFELQLSNFLAGEIEAADEERLEAHLASCAQCRNRAGVMFKQDRAIAELSAQANAPALMARITQALAAARPAQPAQHSWRTSTANASRKFWMYTAGSIAALIAVVLSAVLYFGHGATISNGVSVVAWKGEFETRRDDASPWEIVDAAQNKPFAWNSGASVRSSRDTGALTLADGSQVTVASKTEVRLAALSPVTIKLENGSVICAITHPAAAATGGNRPVRFIVRTPDADVNVTGTEFGVKCAAGNTEVAVLEGTVNCTNEHGATLVSANHSTVINSKEAPPAQVDADVAELLAWRNPTQIAAIPDAQASAVSDRWTQLVTTGLPVTNKDGIYQIRNTQDGKLVVALGVKGIFESPDAGRTWTSLSDGLNGGNIHSLLPGSKGELFAAPWKKSGEELPSDDRVFCFTLMPGTTSWKQASGDCAFNRMVALCEDSKGRLLAASLYSSGILRSDDDGRSFKRTHIKFGNQMVLTAMAKNPITQELIVGSSEGFFRSSDDGATWNCIRSFERKEEPCAIGFTRSGDELLADCNVNTFELFLFHHQQGKPSMATQSGNGLPVTGFIREIITAADGTLYTVVAGEGVFSSSDDGVSWKAYNEDLPVKSATALWLSNDGKLYVGTKNMRIFIRRAGR